MRTKHLPFQLEEKTGGAFVVQGLAGGILLGYIFVMSIPIFYPHPANFEIVFYAYPVMAVTGVLGLIKAIPLGGMYHITGIRMRLPVRILVGTIGSTLFLSIFFYKEFAADPRLLLTVAKWCFLISLPIAMLVGSRVRPWRIFTYWRVTFRENGIKERLSSSGIFALGGVLPLRLLSIGGLSIWILATAAAWSTGVKDLTQFVAFYIVPLTYFAVSAYLTFSSPSQFVLLASGLLLNLLIIYISLVGHGAYPQSTWTTGYTPTALAIADAVFIGAWIAFVITRFVVEPKHFLPAGLGALLKSRIKHNHHCLGSRFVEWRT